MLGHGGIGGVNRPNGRLKHCGGGDDQICGVSKGPGSKPWATAITTGVEEGGLVELKPGGINYFTEPIAALQPGKQSEDLVGRSDLEPTGPTIGTVSGEVHCGGARATTVFGVVEDLVLRHGKHATGADLNAGGSTSQVKELFFAWHQFPYAVLGNGLQGEVQCRVHIEATDAPATGALFRGASQAFEVGHVLDHVVTEVLRVLVGCNTAGTRW